MFIKGLSFSSEGGSQICKKSTLRKFRSPHFGNNNFMTPHHRYTLPPKQAKFELKSVVLNKINTPSVVIWSSCDSLHFGHQKILWPPIFLSKNLWPPIYLGHPFRRKWQPLKHTLQPHWVTIRYHKKQDPDRWVWKTSKFLTCLR